MKRIKPRSKAQNVPPGGWTDVEPQTGVLCQGATFKALVRKEAHILALNGKPLPEDHELQVELRMVERLYKYAPDWVYDPDAEAEAAQGAMTTVKALNNAKKVLDAFRVTNAKKVPKKEVMRRAAICLACSHRGSFACLTCDGTHAELQKRMGTMKTDVDDRLGGCLADHIFNRTHIWFPKEVFLAMIPSGARWKTERYPETCWKRQLLETTNGDNT